MLIYNIDFEVTGILLNIIMIIFVKLQYKETRSINEYIKLLYFNCTASTLDATTVFFYTYPTLVPIWFNYLITSLGFIFSALASHQMLAFINVFVAREEGKKSVQHVRMFSLVLIGCYSILFVINAFIPLIFSFDEEGHYQRIGIYPIVYIIPCFYLLFTFFYLLAKKKVIKSKQAICVSLFIGGTFVATMLQFFVFPDIFLTFFGSSLALLCMLFMLETPDYVHLINTMKQLGEAKMKAEASEKSESQFLANMSHELRTPINAVIGLNEMILRESHEPSTLDYARKVKNSGKMLLEIINEVLDFSRIRSGNIAIAHQSYSVSASIHLLYEMIRERARSKGLEFRINVDPQMPAHLIGDDARIRQVIVNLLTNAVKYTPRGSVELTIGGCGIDNEFALSVSVKDTGIGIKTEDMDKLFGEFVRLDEDKNRSVEGTGLGMNITQRLLMLMGSTLEVESEYGKGSRFFFTLMQEVEDRTPLGDFNPDAIEQPDNENCETTKQTHLYAPLARILITDDNSVNLVVITALLKQTAINCTTCMSGEDTIELAKKEEFDLILLDSRMPNLDGTQTLRILRDEHICDNTPVIVLTADAIAGAKEEYLKAGFDGYLSKPIDYAELEKTLDTFIPESCKKGYGKKRKPDYVIR